MVTSVRYFDSAPSGCPPIIPPSVSPMGKTRSPVLWAAFGVRQARWRRSGLVGPIVSPLEGSSVRKAVRFVALNVKPSHLRRLGRWETSVWAPLPMNRLCAPTENHLRPLFLQYRGRNRYWRPSSVWTFEHVTVRNASSGDRPRS